MANTTIPSELIADGAITSAKLDTNIAVGGTLTVTGDANFDSNTLFVDASANAVGIGTSSPSVNTEIRGSASNGQLRLGGSTTATYANIYSDNDGVLILGADAGNNAASSYFGVEVDGTERFRILSDGAAAFGCTTSRPAEFTHPDGFAIRYDTRGQFQSTVTSAPCAIINRDGTDGDIFLFRKEGTAVGSIGTSSADGFYIHSTFGNDSGLVFGSERIVPCTSTGAFEDGLQDLGYSSGRFKDLYLSGGVYLGGTGAANKLDGYEEGTWTPILSFGGGTTGIGYGQQSGTYTKIGNIVCANFTIVLNSKGSSGGAAVVSALPYAVGFANHAFFIYSDRVTTTGGVVAGYINSGTSIKLYNQVSGSNSTLSNSEFVNDSYISGVFTYRVA